MSELWVEPAWAIKRDLPAATPKQEKDRGSAQGMMRRMFPDVKRWNLCIPVSVYDLNGFYVATYPSTRSASRACGLSKSGGSVSSMVSNNGKSKDGCRQLRGFQFRRARRMPGSDEWDKSPIAKYRGHYYWRYWNQTHK